MCAGERWPRTPATADLRMRIRRTSAATAEERWYQMGSGGNPHWRPSTGASRSRGLGGLQGTGKFACPHDLPSAPPPRCPMGSGQPYVAIVPPAVATGPGPTLDVVRHGVSRTGVAEPRR